MGIITTASYTLQFVISLFKPPIQTQQPPSNNFKDDVKKFVELFGYVMDDFKKACVEYGTTTVCYKPPYIVAFDMIVADLADDVSEKSSDDLRLSNKIQLLYKLFESTRKEFYSFGKDHLIRDGLTKKTLLFSEKLECVAQKFKKLDGLVW